MAEKEVRKTTVKKAPRRTTTKVVSSRTAVRKTAAVSSSVRKAPSRTAAVSSRSKQPSKAMLAFVGFFIVVVGASVAVGYSDKGSIDVSNMIATRKQNATPEEQERFSTVPVQQGQNNVVNGGLVGTGKEEEKAPVPETATTSASSSAAVASSTEEAVSDPSSESSAADEEQTEADPALEGGSQVEL